MTLSPRTLKPQFLPLVIARIRKHTGCISRRRKLRFRTGKFQTNYHNTHIFQLSTRYLLSHHTKWTIIHTSNTKITLQEMNNSGGRRGTIVEGEGHLPNSEHRCDALW